jgi:hypothetical protein
MVTTVLHTNEPLSDVIRKSVKMKKNSNALFFLSLGLYSTAPSSRTYDLLRKSIDKTLIHRALLLSISIYIHGLNHGCEVSNADDAARSFEMVSKSFCLL